MRIYFAASEGAPFIKTGGLADVASALPGAIAREGHDITVFLPLYSSVRRSEAFQGAERIAGFETPLAWRNQETGLYVLKKDGASPRYCFIENDYYFGREGAIYGHADDGERFAFFSRAVVESFSRLGEAPDLIHCNDWQTALVPVFLREFYPQYNGVRTLFTIHNVEYQGVMPPSFADQVLGLSAERDGFLMFDGNVNLMKAAVVRSDGVTTVSETYAEELQYDYYAHGLTPVLRENRFKLTGITNGIDTELFDPLTDRNLPRNYGPGDLAGKRENKIALQKELGLWGDPELPLVGMVSRLVSHKGLDLVERVLWEMTECGIQFAILGTGDAHYEGVFTAMSRQKPDMISVTLKFSSALASRIYAGSDLFLMPSRSEPCGLAQMVAMRYGTVPVVRETGGLKDTVTPYRPSNGRGCGFTFCDYNAHEMKAAVLRGADLYRTRRDRFDRLRTSDMKKDFSWKASVRKYLSLYRKILRSVP